MSESKIVRPIVLTYQKFLNMYAVMKKEGLLKWEKQTYEKEKRPIIVVDAEGEIQNIASMIKKYGGE
jgi:hypothetical protein